MVLVRSRLFLAAGLFGAELAVLAYAYQIAADFECAATGASGLCSFLGGFIARAVSVAAGILLTVIACPEPSRTLLARIELQTDRLAWLALHLAGVALLLLPLAAGSGLSAGFGRALVPWAAGGGAAAIGALLWLAPAPAWAGWLRGIGPLPLAALAAAFLLPDVARRAQPLWDLSGPARLTFASVHALLSLVGAEPVASTETRTIGVAGFTVEIARACSGVEGLALMLGLSAIYALLFRGVLRQARFWLVVVPLCLVASWGLNVLRITALVAIGAHLSPDFAANGFHSYAGWLLFTLLAMAMLAGAHAAPWLRHAAGATPADWRRDWTAACILPFVAMMLADVAVATAFPQPDLAYPLRIAAAVIVLLAFRAKYRRHALVPDLPAVACGAVVGVGWLLSQSPVPGGVPVAAGLGAAAWAAARVGGTVLVVPLVEELFFRGYLLARLDRSGGPASRLLALAVSSAAFGLMHDRWLVALLAGLVFGLVYLRRGRLSDAVAAHVAANLVVAGWAAATGDWAAI